MESGIEGALLDLKDVLGSEFNRFGNGVTVNRATKESAEYEQIESALKEFDAVALVFSRHSR